MKFIKILKNTIQTKNVEYYMIADMLSNKKLNPVVNELFIRGRKLNISLAFNTQSYFAVPNQAKFYALFYCEISK